MPREREGESVGHLHYELDIPTTRPRRDCPCKGPRLVQPIDHLPRGTLPYRVKVRVAVALPRKTLSLPKTLGRARLVVLHHSLKVNPIYWGCLAVILLL